LAAFSKKASLKSAEAMRLLREAVLIILGENDTCLNPSEISHCGNIYRERGPQNMMNDAIVSGVLNMLLDCGMVERCNPGVRGAGWRITPAGRAALDSNDI
jgi:hypothetical protein